MDLFKTVKIVTASNSDFREIYQATKAANSKFGMAMDVYDVGNLGEGTPCPIFHHPHDQPERIVGRCPWKPQAILQSLETAFETLLWLDADAWIIRPIPPMNDCDIAVTMRRQCDRGRSDWPDVYGYLNSGVVFCNPTINAVMFVKEWVGEVPKTASHSDQHALNNLVRQCTDLTEYNRVFVRNGCRIKILSTDEYNWCYMPQEPFLETKIMHAKTDIRRHVSIADWTERIWD